MKKFPKGVHAVRLKSNPEEKRFADAWDQLNHLGNNLAHLLDTKHTGIPTAPSDRDYQVAATVIQWLGSPVGENFLKDLGYFKEKTPR